MINPAAHVRANAVAYVALFLSIGTGAGVAAQSLSRNSVGTKQLRNGSVTGSKLHRGAVTASKVAKDSLTGRQIRESTLAAVPKALHASLADAAGRATSAAAADTASAAANGAVRVDFQGQATDAAPATPPFSAAAHQILSLDELTLQASCIDAGAGSARIYLTAHSSVPAHLSWSGDRFNNPGITPVLDGLPLAPGAGLTQTFRLVDLTGGNRFETDEFIYRNDARTITFNLHAGAKDFSTPCDVEGTAVAAPR